MNNHKMKVNSVVKWTDENNHDAKSIILIPGIYSL
jgi:hypothetical protein